MAKVISVSCIKGGVGKTTTVVSLGGIIASEGKKVLLVDMDPQCNLTNTFTEGNFDDTIYEAFRRRRNIPVVNVRPCLDIVPSCMDACGIESEFLTRPDIQFTLKNLLAPVRDSYDWILIDSPAQLGIALGNSLVASDHVLIPVSGDKYSFQGLKQATEYVDMARNLNPSLDVLGIFLTKYRDNRKVDRIARQTVAESDFADRLMTTFIRENAAIVQAPLHMTDVWTYKQDSNGAQDYFALYKEIQKVIKKKRV